MDPDKKSTLITLANLYGTLAGSAVKEELPLFLADLKETIASRIEAEIKRIKEETKAPKFGWSLFEKADFLPEQQLAWAAFQAGAKREKSASLALFKQESITQSMLDCICSERSLAKIEPITYHGQNLEEILRVIALDYQDEIKRELALTELHEGKRYKALTVLHFNQFLGSDLAESCRTAYVLGVHSSSQ